MIIVTARLVFESEEARDAAVTATVPIQAEFFAYFGQARDDKIAPRLADNITDKQ